MRSDARLQEQAVDDDAGVLTANLAAGVKPVEVDHIEDKVGVGLQINRQLLNIELVNFKSCVVVHFVRKTPKPNTNTDISVLVKTNFIKQIILFQYVD